MIQSTCLSNKNFQARGMPRASSKAQVIWLLRAATRNSRDSRPPLPLEIRVVRFRRLRALCRCQKWARAPAVDCRLSVSRPTNAAKELDSSAACAALPRAQRNGTGAWARSLRSSLDSATDSTNPDTPTSPMAANADSCSTWTWSGLGRRRRLPTNGRPAASTQVTSHERRLMFEWEPKWRCTISCAHTV